MKEYKSHAVIGQNGTGKSNILERCSGGGNPAAKQKAREHLCRIRSMTRKDAELSSVAKWYLLFRNDPQILKLAA